MSKCSGTLASSGVRVPEASITSARSAVVKRSRVPVVTGQRAIPATRVQPVPLAKAVAPAPRVNVSSLVPPGSSPVAVTSTTSVGVTEKSMSVPVFWSGRPRPARRAGAWR